MMRMTKETKITADPPAFKIPKRDSSVAPRHCSVIGQSRFVIVRLVLVVLMALSVSCVGRRLTKANVDEIAEGMSKKQVESILGPPTNIDNKDFLILKKTTYVYHQGKDTVTIVFKDDKVSDKQSTLTD